MKFLNLQNVCKASKYFSEIFQTLQNCQKVLNYFYEVVEALDFSRLLMRLVCPISDSTVLH